MEQQEHTAEAVHLTDGDNHIVGLKSLRVMLLKDGDMWFAQGLEIDYAACGETAENTQENFLSGLRKTISEHLKLHGSIDNFLKIAPQEVWDEYFKAGQSLQKIELTTASFYGLKESDKHKNKSFPFNDVEFLELNAA